MGFNGLALCEFLVYYAANIRISEQTTKEIAFSFCFSAKDKASGQHIAAIVTASNPVKTAPILGTGSNYMEDQRGERFVHPLQTSEPDIAAIHDIAYPNQGGPQIVTK
jgi:hypothetical protein